MTAYSDAVATVRAARAARDAARDALYELQLRRLGLQRADARQTRGEGATDPADEAALRTLRARLAAARSHQSVLIERLRQYDGLDEDIVALQQRLAEAPAAAAAAQRDISERADQLRATENAKDRAAMQDALRAAQAGRADAAEQDQRDRDALAKSQQRQVEAAALERDSTALRASVAELEAEASEVSARTGKADLSEQTKANKSAIERQRQLVDRRERELNAAIGVLVDGREPPELIGDWDDALPIMLLPVRIETRWRLNGADKAPRQLLVRVYPDDIAVSTHEKILTDSEVTYGQAYWNAYRNAGTDAAAQNAAWSGLADRFGANRAAWVARETQPTNWAVASLDATVALEFPAASVTKPSGWTTAPHSRVLPDRFVLVAWRGDVMVKTIVGTPVSDIVIVGPSPSDDGTETIDRADDDGTVVFGDSFAWVRDFDLAVDAGLGFRVAVDDDDITNGFDRLVVLGLKHSADAPDAQALIEDLIDGHHYSRAGFSLLAQGTPTNNTGGNDSGYSRGARGETGVAESGPTKFTPTSNRAVAADGQRLADYLGLRYDPLLYAAGADLTDNADAVAMNRALYAGTLGYSLDHILNEVVDEAGIGALRRHFTDGVTGRGPIAAIRVGNQPYGILPTSSLGDWRTPNVKTRDGGTDVFEITLLRVLRALDERWSSLVPGLVQVTSAGDVGKNLLTILGLQPTSAELYQRVGYSYDYLKNLEEFAWGGSSFADVLNSLIEGTAAWNLVEQLGYDSKRADGSAKPIPLLIELIWRRYHTQIDPKQLVDGLPLSEDARIKPFDAAGMSTYIDWLLAHASDAAALERQDFGGVAKPGFLLYLMLHFSIVMEGARAIRDWLGSHDVNADELVRSRKFMNVGPQATPSIWEVFKAPANAIVATELSNQGLLALVSSPQTANGAGQSVQEQQAAIGALGSMSTARLERALVEHIDLLTYRLDAWETSLFTRRLDRLRHLDAASTERTTGVYLGSYGYLESVKAATGIRQRVSDASLPQPLQQGVENVSEDLANGGFVHAPSLNHATGAALLRSGYLTHATAADPMALAVNLASGRAERAEQLIEGIRNGQSLEVLLGVQFERGLHDWTARAVQPVILDQLKPVFRTKFPILKTRVPQAKSASEGTGAAQIAEDQQVTNGLTLARTTDAYPYGIPALSALSQAQQDAILLEKDRLEDTLDALRDLLTAESAYQLALGNFDRAAGVLQAMGLGTVPPDIEVLDTPRATSLSFTQRLAVQFTTSAVANPWPAIPMSERAKLEPSLNAWLGDLLGAPETIFCSAAAIAADGTVLLDGGVPIQDTVSLADLGMQPIDFVFIARNQVEASGAAELEQRVRFAFARRKNVGDDVVVRIAFADAGPGGGGAGARSFAEMLPLADRLRRLVGKARVLDGRHFQSASKDTQPVSDNPGRIDAGELRTRVGARLAAVRALFAPLQAARDTARANPIAANLDALRDRLIDVANAGVTYAFPQSSRGAGDAQLASLSQQADAILARGSALGTATDDELTQIDATTGAEKKASMLADVVKVWMGSDFVVLPRFDFPDADAVDQADAVRDSLVAYVRDTVGEPLAVDEWLHGAACVRASVHDFEMVRVMAEAWRDEPLALSPIQLPFRANDSWLAATYPSDMQIVHDTISIAQHLPQGFDARAPQCGLLIDEWIESIPERESVTGLAFNFNAPNSAAPQAVLLAVTPDETGRWQWDHLVNAITDTFRRARLRAVEPDALGTLPALGTLLPAVIAEFSTSKASVSLDYAMAVPFVRAAVDATLTVATNQ